MESRTSWLKKLGPWTKRFFRWCLILFLGYVGILIVGLIPVNNDFEPAEDGVKLYIISNTVHADVIVPAVNEVVDWRETFSEFDFEADVSQHPNVAFGWGDRGFFLETRTWADFKTSTAANALLLPSQSCMHVNFTKAGYYGDATEVTISIEQYRELVDFINASFQLDSEGKRKQIQGHAYSATDAFFDAKGRYHLLNTCNSWIGRALKQAGVRVPWLSPLPKSPMIYLD